jgi:hypothetical protein
MSFTRLRRRAAGQTKHDAECQSCSTSLALLQALATGDDDRARRLGHALFGVADSAVYTKGCLPPELSTYKSFARLCASGEIPGAAQTAKRGPWRVSREAWHAARSLRPPPRLHLRLVESDEQIATRAIARGEQRQ